MKRYLRIGLLSILGLLVLQMTYSLARRCREPMPIVRPAVKVYSAPGPGQPDWVSRPPEVHTRPVIEIPHVTRKIPSKVPLPVPDRQVARVIEVSPPAGTSGPTVTIVETTSGELIVPGPQADRVRVIDVRPPVLRLTCRPLISVGITEGEPDKPYPAVGLGLLSIHRDRVLVGIHVSGRGFGPGLHLRVWRQVYAGAGVRWSWADMGRARPVLTGLVSLGL